MLGTNGQHAGSATPTIPPSFMSSTEDLTTLRNLIEYRLLAYAPDRDDTVGNLAHTAALLFMHGVIFPLPSRLPMEMLIQRLNYFFPAQGKYLHTQLRRTEELHFLVQVLMIGALATSDVDTQERSFFVEQLAVLSREVGITSWAGCQIILEEYTWVDWGCNTGGIAVWRMVSKHDRG